MDLPKETNNESQANSELDLYFIDDDPEVLYEKLDKPKELLVEPRPTFIKMDITSSVQGSAYLEYGNTKVKAIVEAPREIKTHSKSSTGKITCSVKYPNYIGNDANYITRKERTMTLGLKKAIVPAICRRSFFNFELDIRVIIIEDDGCVLSTAINCCTMALVQCGVPIYHILTASTVCFYKDTVFLNPTANVEKLFEYHTKKDIVVEYGYLVVATFARTKQVTACYEKGFIKKQAITPLIDYAIEINELLTSTFSTVILENIDMNAAKNPDFMNHNSYQREQSELKNKVEESTPTNESNQYENNDDNDDDNDDNDDVKMEDNYAIDVDDDDDDDI